MRYIKEFDTLRAVAVTLVVISHTFPNIHWLHRVPLGMIGVTFFFVLSGYLISNILFGAKENGNRASRLYDLKVFYLRRALRIFPAYYLFLFINYLFKNQDLLNHPIYFLLYFQNILFFKTGQYAGALSPTWTLAVEEQFYLFWPIVLLFTKDRYIGALTATLVIFSPIFRVLVVGVGNIFHLNISLDLSLMPSNLISLASGAYLAWYQRKRELVLEKLRTVVIPMVFSVLMIVLSFIVKWPFLFALITQFTISAISLWVINAITLRAADNPVKWLSQPMSIYIGKISYGIYLYHTIAMAIFSKLIDYPLSKIMTGYDLIDFIVDYCVVVLLASISWHLFERPMNKLKKFFEY